MMKFRSVDELLDYAIIREQQACDFYTHLADKVADPEKTGTFNNFAADEMMHKRKLQAVKKGTFTIIPEEIGSLDIAEDAATIIPTPEMTYLDTINFAMKKEMNAFRLYSNMAKIAQKAELTQMFKLLAQEEAKHKLHFEIEFDLMNF
jgi:rubrerythrin